MAELLKRKYDLVVFKVTLDTTGEHPTVRCQVETKIGGEPQVRAEWKCTAAEMGVPERIDRRLSRYRGYEFSFPKEISSPLREWLEHEIMPDVPLWLHLVRPSGYLAMVPWERLLQPILNVPMLRLPEFV